MLFTPEQDVKEDSSSWNDDSLPAAADEDWEIAAGDTTTQQAYTNIPAKKYDKKGGYKGRIPLTKGEEQLARSNLKKLIRKLCLWPKDQMVPAGYDIYQGLSKESYGLTRAGQGMRNVIILLLLESPIFVQRANATNFLTEVLGSNETHTRQNITKIYRLFTMGGTDEIARKLKITGVGGISTEIVNSGFAGFNPFTDEDYETYSDPNFLLQDPAEFEVKDIHALCMVAPSSRLKYQELPNFLSNKRNKSHIHDFHEKLKDRKSLVLDWLHINIAREPLHVTPSSRQGFGPTQFGMYISHVFPEMYNKKVFALVANCSRFQVILRGFHSFFPPVSPLLS